MIHLGTYTDQLQITSDQSLCYAPLGDISPPLEWGFDCVVADLPFANNGEPFVPTGDYLLTVATGNEPSQKDAYDLTIRSSNFFLNCSTTEVRGPGQQVVSCPYPGKRTGGGIALFGSGNKFVTLNAPEGQSSWTCAGSSNVPEDFEVSCKIICCSVQAE